MLRKYAVVAVMWVLSLGMMLLMDMIVGQHWQDTLSNVKYQLITGAEKLIAVLLLAGWLVPDLIKVIMNMRKKRSR
ncbi:hypothetical protein EJP77_06875 [Paenibacillus zeisoli]|uniref:Uncharacterized protein n=1 Tax=Paenibacillus zeisoli TaxID=2496267 RepID=A0A3S1D0L1_9BACL|nr:hypothetical protein [Paenibacillus zeisoli]RUT33366.1 hypothetical protein EJP77_06875 [Paenibacillus zeisoli]